MALKTENLAIILTDIVGFTETTAHQSRKENEQLLSKHNEILYPIIKKFKGKVVKTIGDALLVIFRSPTDAMLCSMGMQDALYAFNRNQPEEKQIHIRIAASLGEVRVTKGDIFGEPVNTTSRIENITPADEIYLSEAIYMAMNKAEVPSKEVGWRELKGISEPIRIFNIPRFSTPRLIPEDEMESEDIGDLVYPYGGAHMLEAGKGDSLFHLRDMIEDRAVMQKEAVIAVLTIIIAMGIYFYPGAPKEPAAPPITTTEQPDTTPPAASPLEATKKTEPTAEPATPPADQTTASIAPATTQPTTVEKKTITPAPAPVEKKTTAPAPAPVKKKATPAPVVKPEPLKDEPKYKTFSLAKSAYSDGLLSKTEYKEVVRDLKLLLKEEIAPHREVYDAEIQELKQQYRDRVLNKTEYKEKVREAKIKYNDAVKKIKLKYK